MTRPRTPFLLAAAAAALSSPALALAADPPAPTTPAAAPVQAPADQVGQLNIPDDAKYYSDLGSLFRYSPVLGPAGTLDWFFSRQRSADDPRAMGVASAIPFASGDLFFGTVPGTVGLRTSGFAFGDFSSALPVATTDAVAVDGRTWVVDHRLTPRPARTVLEGIRDGASGVASQRVTDYGPVLAIPTDAGLRTIGLRTIKRKRTPIAVTNPGSRIAIEQRFLSSVSSVAALPGGRLMIAGPASSSSVPDAIVIVDRRGHATRLGDRRKPAAPVYTGRAGMVALPEGVVVDEGSQVSPTPDLDKSAVVLRSTKGKVLLRRSLSDLEFPKHPSCLSATRQFHAVDLFAGPDGLPVLTIACGNTGPHTVGTPPYSYVNTGTFDDQFVMVGLRADLTVRWWRNAPEQGPTPSNAMGYARYPSCNYTSTGATATTGVDGRLLLVGCQGELRAVSVPGVGTPPLGKLVRSTRDGKQAVRARIACRGAAGTVCSGRVQVLANGVALATAQYALPGRPGAAQGELDRQIVVPAELPKQFTVKLLPRN